MKYSIVSAIILCCCVFVASQESEKIRIEAISMRDCLLRAIRFNLELETEGYNPKISEFDLMLAQSEFDPVFLSSFSYGKTEEEQSSVFRPSAISQAKMQWQFQKKHIFGGTIGFVYNINYTDQQGNERFVAFNPLWEHNVSFQINQPLLRNLGIDINRTQIRLAQHQMDISFYKFYQKMLEVLANVQLAYWDLVNARKNYELQKQSLELAENLFQIQLERNRVGSLARADIIDAERNVAFKRDSLVVAEQNIYTTEDRLKQLIRPMDINYYKEVRLVPTERLSFQKTQVNFDQELAYAIEHRPEIAQSKLSIDSTSLQIDRAKNQLLPKLDFTASVGYSGTGTSNPDAWEPVQDLDFPSWQVGVSLELPIGNRAAISRYKKSLVERKQLDANRRQVESLIILDVRQAVRDLETAMRRVETARIARELAEKQLLNEENKFRAGLIALFQVQDTEQKLTEARMQEASTLVNYHRAIVNLYKAKGALLENLQQYDISLQLPAVK